MTTLSVIIPAYNDLPKLLTCLTSLQRLQHGLVEYIIADDASPDVLIAQFVPPSAATVVRSETNGGYCVNVNRGAKHAHGDVVMLVNHDVYAIPQFSQGWNNAITAAFDNPQVGIVGARLLFGNGTIQSAGGVFDTQCQPIHRCLGWSVLQHPEVNTPEPVEWVTGAALAVRRELWEQLGGVDEGYIRGYWEDPDLCLRAKELGYLTWYEPRCTLVHNPGSTGGNPYFSQNAQLFKRRWVDTGKVKPGSTLVTVRYW